MYKRIALFIAGIIVIVVCVKIFWASGTTGKSDFQFSEITRGDLQNTVSSSGTINPVSTIEVGTQVSGIINKLLVDFNDRVKRDQLLAVLDTVLLRTTLLDAEANIEKVQAQLDNAIADYERNLPLFKKGLIAEAEFLPLEVSLKTQKANYKSAEVALQRAKRNLKYAFIRSPIDGTVIQRSVEQGQTVAASLQAPTLFVIAEDLSKMEIHAQVDESDIGLIKEGQKVTFDVQAYPDKTFEGTVRQIRLQPETIQNVVNYTVVIDAANEDYLLLPGMTTTVDFIIEERHGVLLAPNTALRFKPSDDIMADFFKSQQKQLESTPDSLKARRPISGNFPERMEMMNSSNQPPKDFSRVWYLDKQNKLAAAPIKTGITDGKLTEIVRSRELEEGMKVIVGNQHKEGDDTNNKQTTRRDYGPPRPF